MDLHPTTLTSFHDSMAFGVSKGQQVGAGFGAGSSFEHALVWKGTAESALDLNPPGFAGSIALATDGEYQVGNGTPVAGAIHALLWAGAANSAIDLHKGTLPSGYFDWSQAFGLGGGQQVGQIVMVVTPVIHAALWSGTAESEVDLNPADAMSSIALATNGQIR